MLRPSRRSRLLGQERQHERRRGDDLGTRTRSGPAFTTDWPAAGRSASESASWRPPDGLPNPGRYPRAPPRIPQSARQSRFPPPLTPLTPPGPPPRLPPGPAIEGPAACGRRVAVPSRLPLPAPLPVEFAARAPAWRRYADDPGTRTRSGPAFTTDWPAAGRSASESAS